MKNAISPVSVRTRGPEDLYMLSFGFQKHASRLSCSGEWCGSAIIVPRYVLFGGWVKKLSAG